MLVPKPEVDFFEQTFCPICQATKHLVIKEIPVKYNVFLFDINIDIFNDERKRWHSEISKEMFGKVITPMVVLWEEGFLNCSPNIYIVSKEKHTILTEKVEQRIVLMGNRLFNELEPYRRLSYV